MFNYHSRFLYCALYARPSYRLVCDLIGLREKADGRYGRHCLSRFAHMDFNSTRPTARITDLTPHTQTPPLYYPLTVQPLSQPLSPSFSQHTHRGGSSRSRL